MTKIVPNRSKTYMLPLLSEFVNFDMKFMKYLLNTFINIEEEENSLAILHEFTFKDPEFTSYEHRLLENKLFSKYIDIDDKVLYIFKFPEEYLNEYNLFKEGKYSEFGDDAKQLIIKFWAEVYKRNSSATKFLISLKQVLYKDLKLKETIEKELGVKLNDNQELGEIIDMNNETFKIEING